jgi:hypothetical protein
MNLLYIENEVTNHYVLIKDFNRLMLRINHDNNKKYFCYYCLQHFTTQEILEKHAENCIVINGTQAAELPEKGTKIKFNNLQNSIPCPFVIYADIEALLTILNGCFPRKHTTSDGCEKINHKVKSYTIKTQKHEADSFGYKVVCHYDDKYSKKDKMFRGEDAITSFFEALFEEEKEIIENMKTFKKTGIIMSPTQKQEYKNAKTCYICDGEYAPDNIKVRDHCHVTGMYRGAAHDKCNLKLKISHTIPVIFHNLRGYDSHHLMQKIGQFNKNIKVIPNNMEKYMSFSIGTLREEWDKKEKKMVEKERFNLRFIDSYQFMNSSLSQLVDDLKKSGLDKFKYIGEEFGSLASIMTRKGIYPYSFMDSYEKFEIDPRNLKKEHFYNDLTKEEVKEEDFKFFLDVCNKFNIKNLGEYHDLYLKSDVLLLADVFENFRKVCLEYYKLDPCHYYFAPGLSWDACLKMTEIELELISDVDQHLFIEKGLRGGVSIITHRKGNGNNKYMKTYDKNAATKYVTYYDANNLYGWAMSQAMPYGGFKWVDPNEFILRRYSEICDNMSSKGYMLEVDLDYPKELHDLHNEYPYCPEQVLVEDEMLSDYSKRIAKEHGIKNGKYRKLIPTLGRKENYVIHERNLRQAIDAGLVLTKIHRVLEFNQKPWIQDYIEFNTKKRQLAENDFEKNFFKLMNNSFFGKTMENKRKRINVKLISNENMLTKYTSKPTFVNAKIFDENLVAVHCKMEKIKLDKPIYVGFCILDISKTLMYDFHYGYIKKNYGNKAKLLFTDTDSLCYEIETKDIYKDMYENKELFDLSEIEDERLLQFKDNTNKKALGKMKPEYVNKPIEEFIGLKSKMYSIKFADGKEDKKAKGIVKSVIKNDIKHDMYKNVLETGGRRHNNMTVIRSNKHQLYTMLINKVSLSAYDDKRYILDDGISSYAYGHYKISI